jgi:hypothetical protein
VIVRISSEGQFELPESDVSRLNELDNEAVRAADAGDEARFYEIWAQMIALVETDGRPLDGDELVESDVILPPRDTTFEEARDGFSGEGVIPER